MNNALEAARLSPEQESTIRGLSHRDIAGRVVTVPILQALRENYSERGWSVCGPALALELRFISYLTGIPFTNRALKKPHFSIDIGINKEHKIDHSLGFYGSDQLSGVEVYDLVGEKMWNRSNSDFIDEDPSIIYYPKRYGPFWRSIRMERGIYRFSEELAQECNVDLWAEGRVSTMTDYFDAVAVMHSPVIFQDTIVMPSGVTRDVSKYWGKRLLRTAYRAVELMPSEVYKDRILSNLPAL